MCQFKFIFERGINEFIEFNKLDELRFASAKTDIIDFYISSFGNDSKPEMLSKIMKPINFEILSKLITNEQSCKDYENIFTRYKEEFHYSDC